MVSRFLTRSFGTAVFRRIAHDMCLVSLTGDPQFVDEFEPRHVVYFGMNGNLAIPLATPQRVAAVAELAMKYAPTDAGIMLDSSARRDIVEGEWVHWDNNPSDKNRKYVTMWHWLAEHGIVLQRRSQSEDTREVKLLVKPDQLADVIRSEEESQLAEGYSRSDDRTNPLGISWIELRFIEELGLTEVSMSFLKI